VLAVVFSGYLAAVYLAADSLRYAERAVAAAFRRRALAAGVASGALALGGLLVMRHSGLDLTRGTALAMVCVSGAAGLVTLTLCWRSRFALARLPAALAVAAVVIGWAAAQAPRLLPGMTVTQAAAGRSTLVALVIGVACGSVILIPSLALLFTLFLRGSLDTPEHYGVPGDIASPGGTPVPSETSASPDALFPRGAKPPQTPHMGGCAPPIPPRGGCAPPIPPRGDCAPPIPPRGDYPSPRTHQTPLAPAPGPGTQLRDHVRSGMPNRAIEAAGQTAERPGLASRRVRAWGAAAVAGLVAGTGLLVLADSAWAHALGVGALVLCAVSVFLLTAAPSP
jgi:Cytochrome bd terminal oxidase subunit II